MNTAKFQRCRVYTGMWCQFGISGNDVQGTKRRKQRWHDKRCPMFHLQCSMFAPAWGPSSIEMPRLPQQALSHLVLYDLACGCNRARWARPHAWPIAQSMAEQQCRKPFKWSPFPGFPGCCQHTFPSHQAPILNPPRPPNLGM